MRPWPYGPPPFDEANVVPRSARGAHRPSLSVFDCEGDSSTHGGKSSRRSERRRGPDRATTFPAAVLRAMDRLRFGTAAPVDARSAVFPSGTADALNEIGSGNRIEEVVMAGRHHIHRVSVTLVAAFFLGVCHAAAEGDPRAAGSPLEEFMARMDAYVQLHQRFEAAFPPFDETRDPVVRLLNRRYLASAIRAARRHAKEGDVFSNGIEDMFRTRIAEAMAGRDAAVVVGPCGEESWPADEASVNEPFREEASCPLTLLVLEALPPLPGGIEYRIAGPHLILWDVHADIVLDVLREAFRAPSHV